MASEELETIIQREMRLSAIEWLLCRIMATLVIAAKKDDSIDEFRAGMRETLQNKTFGQLGPAISDVAAAELEAAVDNLLSQVKKQIQSMKKGDRQA